MSDPNASYVNGNPSTGVMGSIPPAESIEYPQREIHNYVNITGLTPTNTDLLQLAKAVQSGKVNYGLDVGAPNNIAITPVVPISAYVAGQRFIIKMGYGNTSQVTVNVNGLGPVPLVHVDQTPFLAYELLVGQLLEVAYDGTKFQAIAGASTTGTVLMSQPQNLFVNPNTGDDTLYDGTSSSVTGTNSGPFRTIQKALATMKKYNLGGWTFQINLADGVYAYSDRIDVPLPNGSGTCNIVGNVSNPAAVSVFNVNKGSAFIFFNGGHFYLSGFSCRATADFPGADGGHGIWVMFGTSVNLGVMHWNAVPGAHILVGANASVGIYGDQIIAGGAQNHQAAYLNGALIGGINYTTDPNLTITAPVTIASFCAADGGAQVQSIWKSITGKANVTGARYHAAGNGVINSGGRGATALPGTIPGDLATGGQYL